MGERSSRIAYIGRTPLSWREGFMSGSWKPTSYRELALFCTHLLLCACPLLPSLLLPVLPSKLSHSQKVPARGNLWSWTFPSPGLTSTLASDKSPCNHSAAAAEKRLRKRHKPRRLTPPNAGRCAEQWELSFTDGYSLSTRQCGGFLHN